jgi:hypothetical protein
LNPLYSLFAERTWCTSGSVRADAERILRYRKQAAQYWRYAAHQTVPLARDCLLDMARHLEQLAGELEARNRRFAVDRFGRIELH